MSDRPDDISKEVWSAAIAALDKMPDHGMQMRHHRIENIARAIDQARREGYARGVEDAAKIADTLGVSPELNVWNGGPDWYKHAKRIARAIRALDGKGNGV